MRIVNAAQELDPVKAVVLVVAAMTGARRGELCALKWSDVLTGANLAGLNLSNADLPEANLENANLDGANLTSANLTNAVLTGTNLTGTNLTDAVLTSAISGGIAGVPVSLPTNWMLVTGYLVGPGAELSGADFTGANLTNTNLSSADLADASFEGATLTGTSLTGANLTGVSSGGITGVPSSLPTNWMFVTGYLVGPGAELRNVDLSGANLEGSDLAGADLASANLDGANVTDANLDGAELTFAGLTGVTWSNTTCPDGTNSNNDGGTCVSHIEIGGCRVAGSRLSLPPRSLPPVPFTSPRLASCALPAPALRPSPVVPALSSRAHARPHRRRVGAAPPPCRCGTGGRPTATSGAGRRRPPDPGGDPARAARSPT